MTDVLLYPGPIHAAEMRHEVPVPIPDPFLYLERNGDRHAVITSFEVARLEPTGIHAHPLEEFGQDALIAQGLPRFEVYARTLVEAVQRLEVRDAVVPPTFPVEVADRLRAVGIDLRPDRELFSLRRRVKNETELAGIRKAQRGTEAAMGAAREMLRDPEAPNGPPLPDGEPLTSERIKGRIIEIFNEHNLASDEMIVAHGGQAASG